MTTFTVVTFGTAEFSRAIAIQKRNALRFGASRHIAYDVRSPAVVRARSENAALASSPRGYGLWIWKPYIMLDAMTQCDPGDYLIYLDAGVAPVADMTPWFEQLRPHAINGFAPVPPSPLWKWTRRDCFVHMHADAPDFHDTETLSAGIQAYRHAAESLVFLEEVKALMRDPRLMQDGEQAHGLPHHEGFIAHRHDQSVLSLLAKKRGGMVHREPTQYGIWTTETRRVYRASGGSNAALLNEECPQVLDVHRGRNQSNALLFALWRMRRKIASVRRGVITV